MRRSGLALIIVAGVLGLLAALAMAFTTLAQLERRASRQRLYATKARLLARSGIEDALARLGAGQDPDLPGTRYGGEDWLLDGDQGVGSFDRQQEVYNPGYLDVEACPARQALRPSFFVRRPSFVPIQPRLVDVGGRQRGHSGRLSAGGDVYAIKVTPQAGIWVNGGNPALGAAVGYNAVLGRILGNLAEAVDREPAPVTGVPGADDGSPVDLVDGQNLVDLRPQPGGWTGWEQVRDVALGGSQAKLDAIKPYLALRAWVDTRTLKPDATAAMQGFDLHTWSEIKQGVDASYTPTRGMPALEPRAPVNLAWARSRWPVLVALMGGLKGLRVGETETFEIGKMKPVELVLSWTSSTDPCRKVVSKLVGYTGPLAMDTWDDWNAFCDTLTSDVLDSNTHPVVPAMRSLLKANFNPNSRLNKFNPNRSMWNLVDKQDLLAYSTEFVLEPVHTHEVECVGRVLGRNGRLLASRSLRCEVAGPKVARLSTQREFVCQDLGSLDKTGDETGVRVPGTDSPFLPVSQGPGIKTWGQDLPGLSISGVKMGVGIQPYPEPYVDRDPDPAAWDLTLCTADYDGSLQLATLETDAGYTYTANAAPNDMKMLARWTADLDLAVSDASPLPSNPNPAKRRNQPDTQQAPLTNSLLDPVKPNTLHPDGCYSEQYRTPGYFDKDNANGFHGLMSFWLKPNYIPPAINLDKDEPSLAPTGTEVWDADSEVWTFWPDWIGRNHRFIKWDNYFTGPGGGVGGHPVDPSPDQLFTLGEINGFVTFDFDLGHNTTWLRHNFRLTGQMTTKPHRWRLLTCAWDLRAPNDGNHNVGELVLDQGETIVPGDATNGGISDWCPAISGCGGANGNYPTMTSDLTNDDRFGDYDANGKVAGTWPHLIFLGRRGFLDVYQSHDSAPRGADATFDEFAIYDFGGAEIITGTTDSSPAPAPTLAAPLVLAKERFKEGRYYRESAYPASGGLLVTPGSPVRTAAEYFSAPLDLGGGRLRALSWTQVVPRGLRGPLPALVPFMSGYYKLYYSPYFPGAPESAPGKAGIDGDDGEDGRIEMELSNPDGDNYAPDTSGNAMNTTFRNSALSWVNRTPLGPFRLHAVFRPNLANMNDTPILDPLALDDVTLLYDPPGGSRILTWGQGE